MNALELTDANFEEQVLASQEPVVVDVWAPWCGPCIMQGPVIEELAEEYRGRVKVAKLNTDQNPETAAALRIQAIPTILFFKGGRLVDQAVGLRPKAALKRQIEDLM